METLQRTANRGSVSTGFNIDNSIMFTTQGTYADSGSYFWDLIASSEGWAANSNAGTNARKCTVSAWVKRTALTESSHYPRIFSYRAGGIAFDVFFDPSSDQLTMYDDNTSMSLKTNRSFRDTSAFYHIVVAVDQTQSTASNRVKVYVNGVQETSWATEDYGNQNVDLSVFRAAGTTLYVGGAANDASAYFNGYISEYNFIDGSQLAQTEFGEFDSDTGIWIPKEFTGSYGTLGHYYNFTVSNDMGKDFSGNGNDSDNRGDGITNGAARQATDTPTNNFCIMNVLKGGINLSGTVYNRLPLMTDGATVVGNNSTNYTFLEATMGVTSGKWYWEMKPTVDANTLVSGAGIATNTNLGFSSTDGVGNFFYHYAGNRYVNGASTGYGAAWTTNDIIGFAYDADNWTLTCYINNSSQGNLLASQADLSAEIAVPYMYSYGTHTYQWNFGGYTIMSNSHTNTDANGYGSFVYAPPSGYYALCTKNLAEYG